MSSDKPLDLERPHEQQRPILFSAPMVRAIREGRKTQTRRVVKPEHIEGLETDDAGRFSFMHSPDCGGYCDYACAARGEVLDGHIGWTPWGSNPKEWGRLWVRENGWEPKEANDREMREGADTWPKYAYDADGLTDSDIDDFKRWGWKRRPSIYMPRWACRIVLQIEGVRVERLTNISAADAWAEGIRPEGVAEHAWSDDAIDPAAATLDEFRASWDALNEKRGYGWKENPWVWALTFAVHWRKSA